MDELKAIERGLLDTRGVFVHLFWLAINQNEPFVDRRVGNEEWKKRVRARKLDAKDLAILGIDDKKRAKKARKQ